MKDLIKALTIFAKYIPDSSYPTHCEHDILSVMCDPAEVSDADTKLLAGLGFFPSDEASETFFSFRYGSA